MLAQLYTDVCSLLNWTWGLLNSSFWTALVGAFAGAIGAQVIAEKSKARADAFEEIRRTNAAMLLSFSICNMAMALKTQHVQPMIDAFNSVVERIERFNERVAIDENSRGGVFAFEADFRTFPGLSAPIQPLKPLVFEKLSLVGRPLSAFAYLETSLSGLNDLIQQRAELVREFSRANQASQEFAFRYCGLTLPDGNVDQRYHDVVISIDSYTRDVIFFAVTLSEGLLAHGNRIRDALPGRHQKRAPKVNKVDFSEPRRQGLIPPNSEYGQWLRGIAEYDSSKKPSTACRRLLTWLKARSPNLGAIQ